MSVGALLIMREPHVICVTRSIPPMYSIGSHVMGDDTANLKMFIYQLPNIKLYIYINFIKLDRGHEIGQNVARPLVSNDPTVFEKNKI